MRSAAKLVHHALPAGLTVFCWLTMRTVAAFADESMTSYGFPVPWLAPDPVSSMACVISVVPLLFDLAIYVAASFAAISFLWRRRVGRDFKWVSVVVWSAAGISLALKLSTLLIAPQLVAWTLSSYYGDNAQRSHGVHLGLGHPTRDAAAHDGDGSRR